MAIFARKAGISGYFFAQAINNVHHIQINSCPYTVFEYSAACLSVIFKLLLGLIPFAW